MIEDVRFAVTRACDILALDLWDEATPPPDVEGTMLQVEPRRWWLIDIGDHAAAIAESVAGRGALTPIGGAFMRLMVRGSGWRSLLAVSGYFDTEHAGFGPGSIAATVIHHIPVWIAVTGETACVVYVATSYVEVIVDLWNRAIGAAPPNSTPVPPPA